MTGEVILNGTRAASEQSLFQGDLVRTGFDGAAAVTLTGLATMNIASNSEVEFQTEQSLITLHHGTVGIRSLIAGKNVEIQFGKAAMYLPFFESAAAGTVTVAADGTGRVECLSGSVGVRQLNGTEVVFLKPGQFTTTTAEGEIAPVESLSGVIVANQGAGTQNSSVPTKAAGRSHAGYILLGSAAAAGAGAGVAFAIMHHATPTSPSAP